MASVTQAAPWRVGRGKRMRGLKTSICPKRRNWLAAMCSCLGCERRQNQATRASAPGTSGGRQLAGGRRNIIRVYAGTHPRQSPKRKRNKTDRISVFEQGDIIGEQQ